MMPPRAQAEEPLEWAENLIHHKAAVTTNLVVGHTREHRTCPKCVVACGLVVCRTLVYSGTAIDTIPRIDNLALHRGEEVQYRGYNEHQQYDGVG